MNNKGFALAITMALLPVLVGLGLFLFAALGIIQFNLQTQQACRSGGLQGQRDVAPLLTQLLGLNPRSKKLKTDEMLARKRLKIARSTGNPFAIGAAATHLAKVRLQRMNLDQQQKALIRESNRLLMQNHRNTRGQIRSATQQGLPAVSYLKLESSVQTLNAPELAVRPDSTDIAPTYSPLDDFENKQALVHSWQYRLRVRNSFHEFLDGDIKWTPACSVTLKKEGSSWIPKIKKVKSSSRSYSSAQF